MNEPKFLFDETRKFIFEENLDVIYNKDVDALKWLVTSPHKTYLRVNILKTTREDLIREITTLCAASIVIEPHEFLDDVIVISNNTKTESDRVKLEHSVIVGSGCATGIDWFYATLQFSRCLFLIWFIYFFWIPTLPLSNVKKNFSCIS